MSFLDSFKKFFSSQEQDDRSSLSRKVQSAPNDPQARQKLGIFLMRVGEVVEGLDQLARSAVLYEKDGFASKAIAVLRQMLKHDPGSNDFQKWLIRLLAAEGLTADAQMELRKVAAEPGRFTSDEQKIDFFRQTAEFLPKNPLPRLYIADVYRGQRKLIESGNELQRAVKAAVSSGMIAEFSERVRALASLADKEPAVLEICGFLWLAVGAPEEGLPLLDHLIDFEEALGSPERAAQAREAVEAIRRGWDVAGSGTFSFSEVLQKMSAPEESPPPESAPPPPPPAPILSDPGSAPGIAEPSSPDEGEYEQEEDIVRSALGRLQAKVHEEIGDTDLDARYNLGIAYKEMGLLEEAVKEFRLAMRKPELAIGASSLLADTLSDQGDPDAAVAILDEVLASGSPTAEERRDLRYHKAVLLLRSGNEGSAREILLALFEEAPDYRDVRARTEGYRS
ncbi:MAG: tetratricopeptide repeat protein [Deltaproteobacteria bacterium]|nr:tetratricopeptide repeat protein [Deltaproteobacteria bacterium]